MKYNQARDIILSPFYEVWQQTGWPVYWPDLTEKPSDIDTPWCKVIIKTADERQATLSNDRIRYRAMGFVKILMFFPSGQGSVNAYDLADEICNKYRRYKAITYEERAVIFQNVRSEEMGVDGNYNQIDVYAEFIYDKVIMR